MDPQKKRGLIPSIFSEGFFPTFLRQFSLFEDENMTPFKSIEHTNISLSEDDSNVYIEAHMPGLKKEEIEITQDKGILWIRGESKKEEKNEKRKYYYKAANSYSYRVAIPGEIDESKSPKASFENGVLSITYSKSKAEEPKKIKVS